MSAVTSADLEVAVAAQGDVVRQLKSQPAGQRDDAKLAEQIQKLKDLKSQLLALTGTAPGQLHKSSGPSGSSTNKRGGGGKDKTEAAMSGFQLKVPKGTKDHHPKDMIIRQKMFDTMTQVFKRHGGVTIDTPVFELKEILAGKYGEDSKLIYDLKDQGGEICSLRYDLTVPFARFLAMNSKEFSSIKRYHVAKVYRRDQPAMTKGRMREFYQCDFDIAGQSDPMIADSEILLVTCEVLEKLGVGEFTIKLNHRKILDGIFSVCGVPQDKIRTISSAVDKLDKLPWEDVKKEMTQEKGLPADVADKIGAYVKQKGSEDLVKQLLEDEALASNASAKEGLNDMVLLFRYLNIFGIASKISFDLSLARGLDYYTGVIFEAVVEGSAPPSFAPSPTIAISTTSPASKSKSKQGEDEDVDESQVGMGSIAAGGRYDNLVGMFASGRDKIPCVGTSFGVERIFSLLSNQAKERGDSVRSKEVDVYVMSVGDGLLEERMKVVKELWDAGIRAEFMYKAKPKTARQFDTVDKDQIPFIVILGGDEIKAGNVKVKEQGKEVAQDKDGATVRRTEMVSYLRERLRVRA